MAAQHCSSPPDCSGHGEPTADCSNCVCDPGLQCSNPSYIARLLDCPAQQKLPPEGPCVGMYGHCMLLTQRSCDPRRATGAEGWHAPARRLEDHVQPEPCQPSILRRGPAPAPTSAAARRARSVTELASQGFNVALHPSLCSAPDPPLARYWHAQMLHWQEVCVVRFYR